MQAEFSRAVFNREKRYDMYRDTGCIDLPTISRYIDCACRLHEATTV